MDNANGELEALVGTLDAEGTQEILIKGIFKKFKEQSVGIKNKLVSLLAGHLKYYGKRDLLTIQKQVERGVSEENGDDIKPYIIIGDEVMNEFKIITLINPKGIEFKPTILVFKNYSYHTNLADVQRFISDKIVEHNVSHRNTFGDVIHYISNQTLFDSEKLNYNEHVMVFSNGIYDFKRDLFVQLEEPWGEYYFYELPHPYHNNKVYDCPEFKKAVVKWIDKKTKKGYREKKRKILLNDIFEMIGLCMTMNMGYRAAFLNHGPPRCGKSQFFNIVCYIIGKENRCGTSLQRLSKNEFGAENMEFKILNYCGDLPSSKVVDTGMFKNISGGDAAVETEKKGGDKREVNLVCKFWFNGNKFPKLGEWDDDATYDRFMIVPFKNQFQYLAGQTIENFYTLIVNNSNEVQGIIHESIKGFRRLIKRGGFRNVLRENTQHIWNYHGDKIYAFLYDFCEKGPKSRIHVDKFQDEFIIIYPGTSKNEITRGLYNLGIQKKEGRIKGTKSKGYFYYGIDWKDKKDVKKEKKGIIDELFEKDEVGHEF